MKRHFTMHDALVKEQEVLYTNTYDNTKKIEFFLLGLMIANYKDSWKIYFYIITAARLMEKY